MIKSRVLFSLAALFVITTLACRKEEAPKPTAEATPPARAQLNLGPNPWQVPVDIPPPAPGPQSAYVDFGWQTFVALNWPALAPASGGQNGQPDPNSTIGALADGLYVPTVWTTFRDLDTVMLDNGADPGASYTQAVTIPATCNPINGWPGGGWSPMLINAHTFSYATLPKDYINQASGSPLVDQKGWYTFTDIRINESEYNFIRQNQYYLGENQVAAYNGPNQRLEPFPQTGTESGYPALPPYAQYGALEVKAAWRVLDGSLEEARYYTRPGYFIQPDGTCEGPALFGLIALHILRLTPSTAGATTPPTKTWFWASFEQIDNTTSSAGVAATLAASGTPTDGNCPTGQYNVAPPEVQGNIPWNNTNTPNNVCQVTNIPDNVQQANAAWQGKLSGTVWQYYQMVNVLNPCPSDGTNCVTFPPINDQNNQINVTPFANTAIETYAQTNTCTDCHGYAAGNGAPKTLTGADQIFTFVLLNAYMPPTSSTTAKRDALRATFRNPPRSKPVAAKN